MRSTIPDAEARWLKGEDVFAGVARLHLGIDNPAIVGKQPESHCPADRRCPGQGAARRRAYGGLDVGTYWLIEPQGPDGA